MEAGNGAAVFALERALSESTAETWYGRQMLSRLGASFVTGLFAALGLVGCGSAIEGGQADGKDCNASLAASACSPTSFCDAGKPDANGTYPRIHHYADKSHPLGTCRPKGASGIECNAKEQCASGDCIYASATPVGSAGKCK